MDQSEHETPSQTDDVGNILKQLFDEDQSDRPDSPEFLQQLQTDRAFAEKFLSDLRLKDQKRRERALAIIASALHLTAEDYHHLSYLFQHGETPEDYVRAFMYSIQAVAQGLEPHISLVPHSFDRYAVNTSHPQRYGTQSGVSSDGSPISPKFADDLTDDEIRFFMLRPQSQSQSHPHITEGQAIQMWNELSQTDRDAFLDEIRQKFQAM